MSSRSSNDKHKLNQFEIQCAAKVSCKANGEIMPSPNQQSHKAKSFLQKVSPLSIRIRHDILKSHEKSAEKSADKVVQKSEKKSSSRRKRLMKNRHLLHKQSKQKTKSENSLEQRKSELLDSHAVHVIDSNEFLIRRNPEHILPSTRNLNDANISSNDDFSDATLQQKFPLHVTAGCLLDHVEGTPETTVDRFFNSPCTHQNRTAMDIKANNVATATKFNSDSQGIVSSKISVVAMQQNSLSKMIKGNLANNAVVSAEQNRSAYAGDFFASGDRESSVDTHKTSSNLSVTSLIEKLEITELVNTPKKSSHENFALATMNSLHGNDIVVKQIHPLEADTLFDSSQKKSKDVIMSVLPNINAKDVYKAITSVSDISSTIDQSEFSLKAIVNLDQRAAKEAMIVEESGDCISDNFLSTISNSNEKSPLQEKPNYPPRSAVCVDPPKDFSTILQQNKLLQASSTLISKAEEIKYKIYSTKNSKEEISTLHEGVNSFVMSQTHVESEKLILPRGWNHNQLSCWMEKKNVFERVPRHLNGRLVMQMSKVELEETFYGINKKRADFLHKSLRAETDRISRLKFKKRVARSHIPGITLKRLKLG